jgi:hypothetical protein
MAQNPNQRFEQLKETAARARRPFDRDVLLNTAFFLNRQYVEWMPTWGTIRDIPRKQGEVRMPRPVANKIMHFIQQEHAFAMQTKPTVEVQPATTDPQDISLANVCQAYLSANADPQLADFDAELSTAILWALIGGEAFLKWTFDPKEKRPAVTAVSPLDLFTDPFCTKFNAARYVIHSTFMDTEAVYDAYGVEVKPTALSQADQEKTALMRELGQANVVEGAVVNELWMKPTRRYPKGMFAVWCGKDTLIDPGEHPYDHKHIPYTQVGVIPRPGTFHYTCATTYLRSPQMELNKYHAQRTIVREKFSNPKWWIDAALELEADPDDSPAQILKGNSQGGALKPELLQPATFPEQTDGDWITKEMQDVIGLHEITQGQVPGRVEAAKAIEILKESDTSRLAELDRTVNGSITEGFWQWLMITKQYVPGTQIVQTYSREGLPEVMKFKTAKIREGMRIRVSKGAGLAKSRAAREDQVMLLWQAQIIRDPEIVAEMLEVPLGTISPQRDFDIRLARNENIVLCDDKAITPNSWDAHDIHLREHNNYRKTAEFLGQKESIKNKFEFHCTEHEKLQLKQANKDALLAAVAQGAALGGGQPPTDGQTTQQAPPEGEQQPSEQQGAATPEPSGGPA